MRQLLAEGWMHNRVRMVTASFLTKDLHVWWPVGARHFLDHLVDGDLASNNHGWQWVAGTGTDASPYFRVFNPVTQGLKFDPQGDYVRRWVPELAHLTGKAAHEPWDAEDGYAHDYPKRIIDHAAERQVALDRYQRGRGVNVSTTSWRGRRRGPSPRCEPTRASSSILPARPGVAVEQPDPVRRLHRAAHPGQGEVGPEPLAVHLGTGLHQGGPGAGGCSTQLLARRRPVSMPAKSTLARPTFGNAPPPAIRACIGLRLAAALVSRATRSSYDRSGTFAANASVRCHWSGTVHRNPAASRRGARNSSRSSTTPSGGTTATNMRTPKVVRAVAAPRASRLGPGHHTPWVFET